MARDLERLKQAFKDLSVQEKTYGYRPGGMPTTAKSWVLKFSTFKLVPCVKVGKPSEISWTLLA